MPYLWDQNAYLSQFLVIYVTEYVLSGKAANYNTVLIFLEELYYTCFSKSCVFIECVETSTTSEILISLLKHITEKKILLDKKAQSQSFKDTLVAMVLNRDLTA